MFGQKNINFTDQKLLPNILKRRTHGIKKNELEEKKNFVDGHDIHKVERMLARQQSIPPLMQRKRRPTTAYLYSAHDSHGRH
jgi:hypothetical protein